MNCRMELLTMIVSGMCILWAASLNAHAGTSAGPLGLLGFRCNSSFKVSLEVTKRKLNVFLWRVLARGTNSRFRR